MEWIGERSCAPASISRLQRHPPDGNPIRGRIHSPRMVPLDVCARSAVSIPARRHARVWQLPLERSANSKDAPSMKSFLSRASTKRIDGRRTREALELPPSISPAVRDLAQSGPRRVLPARHSEKCTEFFREQGFRYSLSPGEYRKNDLEEFLFRRRHWLLRTLRDQFRYSDAIGRSSCAPGRRISGR